MAPIVSIVSIASIAPIVSIASIAPIVSMAPMAPIACPDSTKIFAWMRSYLTNVCSL